MKVSEGISLKSTKYAYSIKEFVTSFSIGRSRLYKEIKARRISVVKVGSRTIISHEEAMRWLSSLQKHSVGSVGEQ